ncbi:MAG: hypothetical protein CVV27_06485 [Candidatus Melainabacteria bacterium HGW-Melainabacteria-1]|nr:MAG: hypothetical protein CVV27_06485 [Candidatus Melainabacteria bacterium HGW-Melainabacteria-1]
MILDANAHVTPSGSWPAAGVDASVERLLAEMDATGVTRACLVGLPGLIGNEQVLELCARHRQLLPVGSFDPTAGDPDGLEARLRGEFLDRSFFGFKLHPRFGHYSLDDARVTRLFDELARWPNAPLVWICSYLYIPGVPLAKGPVELLHDRVVSYPGLDFVLAHAGGPDLLRLAFALRPCRNAWLELSYTLTDYLGSSVEQDLRHLCNHFEQRLLFGSDFPEVALPQALAAAQRVLEGSKPGAAEAILGGNLATLLRKRGFDAS